MSSDALKELINLGNNMWVTFLLSRSISELSQPLDPQISSIGAKVGIDFHRFYD